MGEGVKYLRAAALALMMVPLLVAGWASWQKIPDSCEAAVGDQVLGEVLYVYPVDLVQDDGDRLDPSRGRPLRWLPQPYRSDQLLRAPAGAPLSVAGDAVAAGADVAIRVTRDGRVGEVVRGDDGRCIMVALEGAGRGLSTHWLVGGRVWRADWIGPGDDLAAGRVFPTGVVELRWEEPLANIQPRVQGWFEGVFPVVTGMMLLGMGALVYREILA